VLQFSSLPEKMKDIMNVSNLEGIM
jgi:hypothetical protein